ncbi:hypothetical protein [uncultured Bacteroides sp.]|uniref:hypothetical protein n=1 Tax=uncultured Bacteroides sp. TaxID=162156 RepID=UPI0025FA3DFC|nr:hypothetical protein [uncultured Bacteroides sp.]
MSRLTIDKLNEHLFEAIEMLKNNSDPNASENEKIDIETAKTIANLGKVAVEGFKVKAQALSMLARTDNPQTTKEALVASGIVPEVNDVKLIQ